MKTISVQDLHEKYIQGFADGVCLIDVRTPEEYQEEHIPHVENKPLDQIESFRDELAGFDTVYIHCKSGGRSGKACEILASLGIQNGVNVEGGISDWKDEGYETIQG